MIGHDRSERSPETAGASAESVCPGWGLPRSRPADEGLARVSAGPVTVFDSKALAKAVGLERDGSVRRQCASNFLVTLGSGSRAFVNVRKTRRP